MRALHSNHLVLHDFTTLVMFARGALIMKLCIMQFSSAIRCCYFEAWNSSYSKHSVPTSHMIHYR